VASLSTRQVEALTSAQIAAMSTTQTQHLQLGSPIILDLDANGISTMSIGDGVEFDLHASGQKVHTGWVGAGDGLLVLDRNGDGAIGDGGELFGTATTLADGSKASNGYAALRELDANGDGAISNADAGYGDLKVWIDSNADGVSQSGELRTLDSLGIARLNVDANATSAKDNGNWVGLASTYETTDGKTHASADVWFVAERPQPDLRSKVTDLVQAMASFDGAPTGDTNGSGIPQLDISGNTSANLAANVGGMVDALKQFDSNGNRIGQGSGTLASTAQSLSKSITQDPNNNGFLTTGNK
jgi:hypothetical protein